MVHDVRRSPLDLVVNVHQVSTNNAETQELNAAQKQDQHDQRGETAGHQVRGHQAGYNLGYGGQHRDDNDDHGQPGHHVDGDIGERENSLARPAQVAHDRVGGHAEH